jgi:drug/metabolite transporter (DMT)-like permease
LRFVTQSNSSNNIVLGVSCAVGAAFCFTINDVTIKFMSGDYPLHEIVFMRATVAIIVTLAIFIPLEGGLKNLKTNKWRHHLLRGLCVFFANTCFFAGLATLKLAEATSIFFVSPLIITLFAIVFLGEKAGPRRWIAVLIGLVGVLIMMRPGSGTFQFAALLPVAAATGYAALHTLTRKMGGSESASTMALYIQIFFIISSSMIGLTFGDGRYAGTGNASIDFLFRAWVWPQTGDIFLMVMIGMASAGGGYLISQAYRVAQASAIAPFEYVAMPLSILWGVLVFSEWPDAIAWLGTSLIVGAGLFVFWREASLSRKTANPVSGVSKRT